MPFVDISLAVLVVVAVLVVSGGVALLSLAPWIPTRKRDLAKFLHVSGLKRGERFYDLGCGDGRVVLEAAKLGANAVGYEMSLAMYAVCRLRQNHGAEYRLADLFNADLSDADVIYVFGTPDSIKKRLLPKLQSELKPGARVVSYAFKFDGWEPVAMGIMDPKRDFPMYLYIR